MKINDEIPVSLVKKLYLEPLPSDKHLKKFVGRGWFSNGILAYVTNKPAKVKDAAPFTVEHEEVLQKLAMDANNENEFHITGVYRYGKSISADLWKTVLRINVGGQEFFCGGRKFCCCIQKNAIQQNVFGWCKRRERRGCYDQRQKSCGHLPGKDCGATDRRYWFKRGMLS